MASRHCGGRAIAIPTHTPARRLPSPSVHCDQGPALDKDALVAFAAKATAALRRESSTLAKLRRPSPFFAILCSLLSNVEERLEKAASLTDSRVLKLLATLERLAKWPEPFKAPARPYDRNAYPTLVLVRGDKSQLARRSIKTLAENPSAINDRRKFQKSFEAFANFKPERGDPELSELTKMSAESESVSNSDRAQYLQKLHRTLCQLCRCPLAVCGGFKANVAVDYVAWSAEADDGITLDSFFLHRHHAGNHQTGEWKETRIRVLLDRRLDMLSAGLPKVHGVTRSDSEDSDDTISPVIRVAQSGTMISDFCKLLRSQELGRLELSTSSGRLFEDGIEFLPRRDRVSLQAPSICLAKVLGAANLKHYDKLLLSYLLAKAVWQFYDSDWIAESWSKHKVQFMQQCPGKLQKKVLLNYRPFISAEFRDNAPPQGDLSSRGHKVVAETPRRSHIFPKILALGITLLEIELGEDIESRYLREFLDADGRPRANAAHMTAGDFINSNEWNGLKGSYLPVRQAIEICVRPDTGQLGTDPARVRENLYRYVVAPLGKLFEQAFECPETYDTHIELEQSDGLCGNGCFVPDPVGMRDANPNPNSPSVLPQVVDYSPLLPVVTAEPHEVREPEAVVVDAEDCGLFGDEEREPPDPKKCKQAEKWVRTFKELRVKHEIGVGPVDRIKVAILDTGIDIKHPDVHLERGRIIGHESFIGGDATVDISGHGTHIAGIVLGLTNNVDLYVAKFTDSRRYEDNEKVAVRERIVKALKRARLDWKVNMISLSFGYSKVAAGDPIQKEIKQCLDEGIVVFASASNDGGNLRRTYPGNYDRVLCIHSATGLGVGSSFNPSPETVARVHNFSVVGECVKSFWPMKDLQNDTKHKYMSGTSFATPVAVSIAAFMVGYIQRKMSDYSWNNNPLSPEGIQKIFWMMSKENKRDGYDWISPQWFFSEYSDGKIQHDLIHELKGYKKPPMRNP